MIEQAVSKIGAIFQEQNADLTTLLKLPVEVKSLTAAEAIGDPGEWDYPLLRNKETLVQANLKNSYGQAFTGVPTNFNGTLEDVFALNLNNISNRAIVIAAINALLRMHGLIKNTIHCKNSEPSECGLMIADQLFKKYGRIKIGIVGYQPAFINALAKTFGKNSVFVTDLSAENRGKNLLGVEIWDGMTKTEELINIARLILVTGSVFVNNTEAPFLSALEAGKPLYFYGTTATGLAWLFDLPHLCLLGH